MYHSFSLVVPLVVIRCHLLYHSLSLDLSLVSLFINDRERKLNLCMHKLKIYLCDKIYYPTSSYLFKVNKGNTRAMREICLKLKIKTLEQCQWRPTGFLISNFEHIPLSISKCLLGNIYIVITLNCNNFTINSAQFERTTYWQILSQDKKVTKS